MTTSIDNHALLISAIVFLSFFLVGVLIQKSSGRKTAQRQKEAWLQHGTIPEHGLIDDSASIGANLACFLLSATGGYIALAILFFRSNPLWVLIFFNH